MADDKKKSEEMKENLDDLSTRVSAAREATKKKESRGLNEATTYGIATRLVAELVSGLVIGVLIGWYLDQWFGTKPWLMIVMIIIGIAAGITNVMRAAKQIAPGAMHNEEEEK